MATYTFDGFKCDGKDCDAKCRKNDDGGPALGWTIVMESNEEAEDPYDTFERHLCPQCVDEAPGRVAKALEFPKWVEAGCPEEDDETPDERQEVRP